MATPDEQALRAMRTGGVTQMADTDPRPDDGRVQLASAFGRFISNVAKGTAREGEIVPEPPTERLLPEGETVQSVQERLAPQMLSPEGQRRFEEAGGDAGVGIQQVTDRELEAGVETVPGPEPVTADAPVQAAAQDAVRTVGRGLADEGDADDLITMVTEPGVVDDTVGIDFNFGNMQGGEDINRTINAMSEIIADPTEAAKRGVVTNQETLAAADELLADELGFTRELLRKKRGTLLNNAEMTATRILLQRSGDRLEKLAREIKAGDGSPAKLVEFRRQMSIHAGIQMKAKGAQTEIARAMQAFKIPVGTEVSAENLTAILNDTGGPRLAADMATGYLDALEAGGRANANKYVSGAWYQKAESVWFEVYMNGLLSATTTQMKNAIATPLFMTYNAIADLGAASVGAMTRAGGRAVGREGDPDGMYFEDIFARLYGYSRSLGDAWATAAKTFNEETPTDFLNKAEAATLRAIDAENLGVTNATAGRAIDHLGRIIRIPGRGLMAADDFWRVIASRGALYEEAVRQNRRSKAAGRTDEEAMDDAMMVMLDPKFVSDEMDAAARYNTLTDDLGDGLLGRGTNYLRSHPLGRLLLPFARVPTNSFKRVAEGHPLVQAVGVLFPGRSNIRDTLLGKNGAKAQQRAIGRLALGSATMAYMHELAINGRMTGAYPTDPQLQKMLPPKWQPYSIVFRGENFPTDKDGDPLPLYNRDTGLPNGPLEYVSYQGFEPVGAFLGIAASTAQHQMMFVDPQDRLDYFSAASLATFEYFRDLPMLQGVGSIVRAIQYEDPSILTDGTLGGTLGPIPLPYSSLVRQINRVSDTTVKKVDTPLEYYTVEDVQRLFEEAKDTDNPYKTVPYQLVGTVKNFRDISWAKGFNDVVVNGWNTQIRSLPWVEAAEEKYAFQYDMLGNEKTKGATFDINPMDAIWNTLTPFKITRGEPIEPYHAELLRLGAPLTPSNKKYQMRGIKLSPLHRSQLTNIAKNEIALPLQVKRRGRVITKPGMYQFRDYLRVLISSPEYLRDDDRGRINRIKNAERRFYEQAFDVLLTKPGAQELAHAAAEREALKAIPGMDNIMR